MNNSASKPFMPEAAAVRLAELYTEAEVILEYGSGGSTELAAGMPNKYVMTVESDRDWARELMHRIANASPRSPVMIHHADIGPTGRWGRPLDDRKWRDYHKYPNEIWDQFYFRDPDVILIDGRFRTACMATAILRARKPTRVLFDDYVDRPVYRVVEQIIEPVRLVDRMAEFELIPGLARREDVGLLVSQFFKVTMQGEGIEAYQL